MNRTQKVILLFEVPFLLILVWQWWSKPFSLSIYVAASALVSVAIAWGVLTQHRNRRFAFLQMVLLAVLARNIYYVATHYSVLPFGDSYTEYALTQSIAGSGHWAVVAAGTQPSNDILSQYSGWPGIDVIGASLSQVVDIDPLLVATLFPQIIFLAFFLVAYGLLRRLEDSLGYGSLVTNIALLFVATSPFLMQPVAFYHQDMGTLYFVTVCLFVYREIEDPSLVNRIILVLTTWAVVVTHHYTSFVLLVFLVLLSTLIALARHLARRSPTRVFKGFNLPTFFALSLIAALSIFLWWGQVTFLIGPHIGVRVRDVFATILTFSFRPSSPAGYISVPGPLKQPWAPVVLYLRDALTLLPALPGLFLILKNRESVGAKFFVLFSLVVAGLFLAIDVLFGSGVGLTYRALFLFIPFIALIVGLVYQQARSAWKRFSTLVLVPAISLTVFACFLGLWAHNYAPVHLYDPAVSWIEAGDHPVAWRNLRGLFLSFGAYGSLDRIITDDTFVTRLVVPTEQRNIIQSMNYRPPSFPATAGYQRRNLDGTTMIVAWRDFQIHSYISQTEPENTDLAFNGDRFRNEVNDLCDLVVNGGQFRVWWGSN